MPNGLFYFNSLDRFISSGKCVRLVFIITTFYGNSCNSCKQFRPSLIRRRVLWRLIWIYTVCQGPFYETLGLNVLIQLSKYPIWLKTCGHFHIFTILTSIYRWAMKEWHLVNMLARSCQYQFRVKIIYKKNVSNSSRICADQERTDALTNWI